MPPRSFSRRVRQLLFLAAFVAGPGFLRAEAQPVAMFRGDAAHSGIFASPAPAGLAVKWTFAAGEPIVASPVIAGGVVYVGSLDNFLYAIDEESGHLKWKFDAHGNLASSVAVANGVVFVISLDGHLYALDAATGVPRWAFATQGERRHTAAGMDYAAPSTEIMPDPWDLLLSSPAVAGGAVYFGSGDGHVYAVEAATGKLRWKFATGNAVHASPAVADGLVLVGSFDAFFYALDAATGALVWKFQTGADDQAHLMTGIPGSATVAAGTVYFGCRDGHVYALAEKTGELRWKFSAAGSWVISTPVVTGDEVCFTTSDSMKFEVLDARSGTELFSLPYPIYSFSSPAIASGHAYFGAFDGKLRDVDLANRKYAGEFATPGFRENGPRYLDAEGKVKAAVVWVGDTLDDAIVGLRGKLFSLGSMVSSPAVHGGVVFIGSTDGSLYALGRSGEAQLKDER